MKATQELHEIGQSLWLDNITRNATLATTTLDSASAKIDWGHGTVGALVNGKQFHSNLTSYRFDFRLGRLLTGSALVIW
jgi:hypothetical protein